MKMEPFVGSGRQKSKIFNTWLIKTCPGCSSDCKSGHQLSGFQNVSRAIIQDLGEAKSMVLRINEQEIQLKLMAERGTNKMKIGIPLLCRELFMDVITRSRT